MILKMGSSQKSILIDKQVHIHMIQLQLEKLWYLVQL